jgi:tetratricopeptide (TPR) repeat protein
MKFKTGKYTITDDPTIFDKMNGITPENRVQLERCHELALEGTKDGFHEIKSNIEKYPEVPAFKNYLVVWYENAGKKDKAFEINRRIIEEHPDYLFGKMNQALEYFSKEEYEKIPEILGEEMEISFLYPEREIFHTSEVTGMSRIAVKYLTATGRFEEAQDRLNFLQEIAPEADYTKDTENHLMSALIEKAKERMENEKQDRIEVKQKTSPKMPSSKEAPDFNHPQINDLYNYAFDIPEEAINAILALPRETLIDDLHLVLRDSISRQTYFSELLDTSDYNEEQTYFVLHAILLLGELRSTESLDEILNVLRQDETYTSIFLGNFMTDGIWEPLFFIAGDQLDKLREFACEPGVNTYARSETGRVVEQIALHFPERKPEITDWFRKVFKSYISCKIEDNVIDSEAIGLLICNVICIGAKELLPVIEKLFDLGYVGYGVCGIYNEVERALNKPLKYDCKEEVLNIYDRYNEINTSWPEADFMPPDFMSPEIENEMSTRLNISPVRSEPKVGRNDPCPCGSGKKYKKCCLL